jgi:hypothetical protein
MKFAEFRDFQGPGPLGDNAWEEMVPSEFVTI